MACKIKEENECNFRLSLYLMSYFVFEHSRNKRRNKEKETSEKHFCNCNVNRPDA